MDKKDIFKAERPKNSGSHVVEGRTYKDPAAVCHRISDMIYKIISGGESISDELQEKCLRIFELSGSIIDSYHERRDDPPDTAITDQILSLSRMLKELSGNDELLGNFNNLKFERSAPAHSWLFGNLPDIKTKEDFGKILGKYVELLNFFALENYPATRRTRQG